ncbi:MAG: 50S ribosomal protein L9, partial [Kamptonema sp. SIO4C4]|nr:50S ribosomal protein L9 [Kamptonema sp. SIO4C4]
MAKRIQVVLNQDVSKLGQDGDVVEVAPGYARNYLVPKGFAIPATPAILREVERRREIERQRQLEIKQQAEDRKTALATVGRLVVRKQVGEEKAIFGTVTNQDIADVVREQAGQDIDKRNVTIPD